MEQYGGNRGAAVLVSGKNVAQGHRLAVIGVQKKEGRDIYSSSDSRFSRRLVRWSFCIVQDTLVLALTSRPVLVSSAPLRLERYGPRLRELPRNLLLSKCTRVSPQHRSPFLEAQVDLLADGN